MSKRQLPLFPSQPATPDDMSIETPLGATFDHFRTYLRREGKSKNTVKAFLGDMQLLADHTGAQTPIGDYDTPRLNEFLDWMENRRGVPCSRKTYARRVTTLKVYFKWLKQLDVLPHDPAKTVIQRSGPAPLSDVLNPAQVRAVLDVAARQTKKGNTDYRPEFLFRLLLETGIKKSEAGRLKLEHIDRSNPERPTIVIRHKTKNVYKERRITVSTDLTDVFAFYREQYTPEETVFTCTPRNLEYILTGLGEDAGVPFKLSFEVLRWTMAVRAWRAGDDEDDIRERMGLSQTSWYETSSKIRRLVTQQVNEEQQQN
jgi:integrase/recombinase XerD